MLIFVLSSFLSPVFSLQFLCVQRRRPQSIHLDRFSYKLQSRPTGLVWVLLLEVSHGWVQIFHFCYSSFSSDFPPWNTEGQSLLWSFPELVTSLYLCDRIIAEGTFSSYLHLIRDLEVTFFSYLSAHRLSRDRLIMRLGCSDVLFKIWTVCDILLSGETWMKIHSYLLRV